MTNVETVGVIGLGYMGASLAKALRQTQQFGRVLGYDSSESAAQRAIEQECIDSVLSSAVGVAAEADLLILCTPVQQIIRLLEELVPVLRPGTIVMDIGSTKGSVTQAMAKTLPENVTPVGGHPMTGPATAGIAGVSAEIYRGRVFVLTPTSRTSDTVTTWCTELLTKIGARVEILDAERHDRLVAVVSHLPRLLPVPLLGMAANDPDTMMTKLPAGGFRDSTRKATDNLDMWVDVVITNPAQIVDALRQLARELDLFAATVADGNEATIRSLLADASEQWTNLFGGTETNNKASEDK